MVERYDVVIVGAGNAALSAAHAAREAGGQVLVLEKAPREWSGGNSTFTAGAIRMTFDGLDELRPLLENLTDALAAETILPPYTRADFAADMQRVTQGLCDPELTAILIDEASDTVRWLHSKGLRFQLMYHRQAYRVGDTWQFWGGLAVGTVDGGEGLMRQHTEAAQHEGVELRYNHAVVGLKRAADGAVRGVMVQGPEGPPQEIEAGAVILAAGGFEANPQLRAAYLGPNWDLAKVRGTPYNTGEVLQMALDLGAQPFGNWSGCHAIAWDAGAPPTGDREMTNRFSRQSYPIGIVVNVEGRRFVDEGADFRNYTYARYGKEILRQPQGIAFQLFDQQTLLLLRVEDYNAPVNTRVVADTIPELAQRLGIDPAALSETIEEYNRAVQRGIFNPAIKDGKGTHGIQPPKSNWALPLDHPPFVAFPVTCGITFTFGGVRVDTGARVLDRSGAPIPGLYAAGELMGGLFYHNYPGGSGLTAGAVFGRRAGTNAARDQA